MGLIHQTIWFDCYRGLIYQAHLLLKEKCEGV